MRICFDTFFCVFASWTRGYEGKHVSGKLAMSGLVPKTQHLPSLYPTSMAAFVATHRNFAPHCYRTKARLQHTTSNSFTSGFVLCPKEQGNLSENDFTRSGKSKSIKLSPGKQTEEKGPCGLSVLPKFLGENKTVAQGILYVYVPENSKKYKNNG